MVFPPQKSLLILVVKNGPGVKGGTLLDERGMNKIADQLDRILASAEPRLRDFDEPAASASRDGKWSRKEILGHLIDSAANNHQRFVRLQSETGLVLPGYQQSDWVRIQNYAGRPWRDLVDLWLAFNRHLAHVIRHADPNAAGSTWKSPSAELTLEFLIEDYAGHLRHHLDQIL
jgi:hypothetical protein